jgi:hypothetical protein
MHIWVYLYLAATPIDPSTVRLCAVTIQDRAFTGLSTVTHDVVLVRELQRTGMKAQLLDFKPIGDAEHEARGKGCNYLMYTDIARADKLTRSQVSAAMKRAVGGARPPSVYEAEVEFRIFKLDAEMPFLSRAVTGRNRTRNLQPRVESRIVEWRVPTSNTLVDTADRLAMTTATFSTPTQVASSKSRAIEVAVERQAKAIADAFRNPPEKRDVE